ncbi:MAG: GTP cyclohydrolase, FolE2/MptA family [Candidatus Hydrothermarchaeales archaeon]
MRNSREWRDRARGFDRPPAEIHEFPALRGLKKGDEVAVVLKAHKNPNFVEDVVRKVLMGIVRRYPDLPGDTMVSVRGRES